MQGKVYSQAAAQRPLPTSTPCATFQSIEQRQRTRHPTLLRKIAPAAVTRIILHSVILRRAMRAPHSIAQRPASLQLATRRLIYASLKPRRASLREREAIARLNREAFVNVTAQ